MEAGKERYLEERERTLVHSARLASGMTDPNASYRTGRGPDTLVADGGAAPAALPSISRRRIDPIVSYRPRRTEETLAGGMEGKAAASPPSSLSPRTEEDGFEGDRTGGLDRLALSGRGGSTYGHYDLSDLEGALEQFSKGRGENPNGLGPQAHEWAHLGSNQGKIPGACRPDTSDLKCSQTRVYRGRQPSRVFASGTQPLGNPNSSKRGRSA
jgi:hypothetical protein